MGPGEDMSRPFPPLPSQHARSAGLNPRSQPGRGCTTAKSLLAAFPAPSRSVPQSLPSCVKGGQGRSASGRDTGIRHERAPLYPFLIATQSCGCSVRDLFQGSHRVSQWGSLLLDARTQSLPPFPACGARRRPLDVPGARSRHPPSLVFPCRAHLQSLRRRKTTSSTTLPEPDEAS
jgi:hypothetical protein